MSKEEMPLLTSVASVVANVASGHEAADEMRHDIGVRIRLLREAKDMTQMTLARLLGKSRACIAQWEGSRSIPEITMYDQLAFHLGSTKSYIAFGDDQNHMNSVPVNLVDYTGPKPRVIGDLALPKAFFSRLDRPSHHRLRATTVSRDGMMTGVNKGDIIVIDEADQSTPGHGEEVLIAGAEPQVVSCTAVPGSTTLMIKVGGTTMPIERDNLNVIGRVICSLSARKSAH